jgi:anti-sigma factor RsiW
MKLPCNVIRDLLPLYAEDMVSPESRALTEEHIAECAACRAALEAMGAKTPDVQFRMDTAKGSFEKTVKSPFGTPANPMDDAAFEAKFDSCAAKAFCPKTPAELDAIKGTVRRLETLADIRELTALL